jgi:mono/diheme cytochrome c family protein
MSGLTSHRVVRSVAPAVPFLALMLSGCGYEANPPYPKALKYILRTDPIVYEEPSDQPFEPPPPGHVEEYIRRIGAIDDAHPTNFGGKALDPTKIPGEDRKELANALEELFGTPYYPTVNPGDDAEMAKWSTDLRLDEYSLDTGSRLYRRHCLTCHGLNGDGRGSTGPWVSPHPRDYRQGVFKFISTNNDVVGRRPRREDLYRTLTRGVDGTSMPAFNLLAESELQALVSYVVHLSLRGQVEYDTMKALLTLGKENNDELKNLATYTQSQLKVFLEQWANSNSTAPNNPTDYTDFKGKELQASISRGYKLFTDTEGKASCINCHIDFGRQVPFRFDVWGTLVRPANLTTGVFRGGRRPIDLYWRIKGGIPPSGMPSATLKTDKVEGGVKTDEYWDLVNFVQALPYPQMLPEAVRAKIYDAPPAAEDHTKTHASVR